MARWWWLLPALGACTPDFADPTTVTDLRLLAISADIPEIVVDVGALAALDRVPDPASLGPLLEDAAAMLPETFPTVTLQPLVVDPHGQGRPVHFRVVTCLNVASGDAMVMGLAMGMTAGRIRDTIDRDACPLDSPLLFEGDVIPGADGVAPLSFPFVATRERVLAAITADPLGAIFGEPITVQITASAGGESVVARKRVVFVPRLTPDQEPNRNPVVTGFTLRHSDDDEGVMVDLTGPMAAPVEVSLGTRVSLEPVRGETESYPTKDLERGTNRLVVATATEALRYAFFASEGAFSPGATTTDPPTIRTPGPHLLASRYVAPRYLAPDASDLVSVWVVVRDERAGSSWVKIRLRLVP